MMELPFRHANLAGSGVMATGREEVGGSWYAFDDSGAMKTGWVLCDDGWVYARPSGALQTGWLAKGGWYWLDPEQQGLMVVGIQQIGGAWYYFGADGSMLTGWHTIDSHYYQFGGDGAMREAEPLATTDIQRQLVAACGVVPTPGPGLCSEWVALVFNRIGQGQLLPNNDYDADDMFYAYCRLDDLSELRVGMIIAVPSHTHTYAGSIWGHICIYVGNNTVMDNIGRIRTMPLDEWFSYYTAIYSPKWGWYNGVPLE